MIKIPKIIHIIWVGEKLFPYQKEFSLWRGKHPSWNVKLWTDNNIPKLYNQKIYNKITSNVIKVDLLRIELLYKYGGVYVDADSECVQSIDTLVDELELFAGTNNKNKKTKVSNGFMGCKRGDVTMKGAVYGVKDYISKTTTKRIHFLGRDYIGPILENDKRFTRIGKEKISKKSAEYVIQKNDNNWKKEPNWKKDVRYLYQRI